jgi:hypothetical protein
MLKHTIKYKNHDGQDSEMIARFNFTEVELLEMETSEGGTWPARMQRAFESNDNETILREVQEMILAAYGEMSLDGEYFPKVDENGKRLSDKFKTSAAYNALFLELSQDATKTVKFFAACLPSNMQTPFLDSAKQELGVDATAPPVPQAYKVPDGPQPSAAGVVPTTQPPTGIA